MQYGADSKIPAKEWKKTDISDREGYRDALFFLILFYSKSLVSCDIL
jgi:hypothetical protein